MKHTFTALDFETAHGKRNSICQVGLVHFQNGVLKHSINKLICPPENFFSSFNSGIHGITAVHTKTAPCFATLWPEIKIYIENHTVVAHNGAFDFSCLSQSLFHYGIPDPVYKRECTYKIYKRNLADLCREHGIALNHHDALSDAMACAKLYQMHLEKY